jgi:hypothetical protein
MTEAIKCLCSGYDLAHSPNPICWKCGHYRDDVTCVAFPRGIPAEILDSESDHHQPYPGDHGIRFEPKNGTAAERREPKHARLAIQTQAAPD